MRETKAVLFDLDGTLLDSRGDLADAVNATRAALGVEPLSDEAVGGHIGRGLTALLEQALPPLRPIELQASRAVFIAHYSANLLNRSRPYEGVNDMFSGLRGYRLGLVTNKPSMFTHGILRGLGWDTRFEVVVCGDTTPTRKPSPEPLLLGLEKLGAAPASAVFVGDTSVDAETAAAVGAPFVCVEWGAHAAQTPRASVIGALSELPAWVERTLGTA